MYFHIPIGQRSRKYLRFFLNNQTYQFTALPFGLATAPLEFIYRGGQRSETDGAGKGYPDPPVPRRLAAQSPLPVDLPTTYPDPLGPMPQSGLGSKYGEVRTYS